MKILFFLIFTNLILSGAISQTPTDSIVKGTIVVFKDPRIDILGKKMAEYNASYIEKSSRGPLTGRGYRLMVISTSNRDLAMKVRSELLQFFPDQKQYMSYQLPNIKIKFGNFPERAEAEKARKLILDLKLVPNNIYMLTETIELKPEKKDLSNNKKEP